MSYATSKQNSENQYNLSEEFLNRTRINLNKSLDTKEWLLPERRRAIMEEVSLVSSQLLALDRVKTNSVKRQYHKVYNKFNDSWNFIMDHGFKVMQNVLQENVIAGWKNMNLSECMFGSIELYIRIFRDSSDTNDKEKWRASAKVILEEKLIASKRALHNLDRVHDAYHNVRPLLNSTVTPNGRYDMIYLTKELFKQSTAINETYTRVRRHITTYIDNIDGLYRIYSADYHGNGTVAKCFSYSNAFLTASFEYVKDLSLYESLVIEDPLKRITKAKKSVECNNILISSMSFDVSTMLLNFFETLALLNDYYYEIKRVHLPIAVYLRNLNNTRKISKLAHAINIVSERFMTYVTEKYIYHFFSFVEIYKTFRSVVYEFTSREYTYITEAMSDPLMRAFVAKLSDHYNMSNRTEKAAMDTYFYFRTNNSFLAKLIRGETWSKFRSIFGLTRKYFHITQMNRALRDLRSFMNNLESFLEMTHLSETFFR